jgi:hypothetical protein
VCIGVLPGANLSPHLHGHDSAWASPPHIVVAYLLGMELSPYLMEPAMPSTPDSCVGIMTLQLRMNGLMQCIVCALTAHTMHCGAVGTCVMPSATTNLQASYKSLTPLETSWLLWRQPLCVI